MSFLFFDFLLIVLSLILATFIRFDFSLPMEFLSQRFIFFIIYSLLMVCSFYMFGEYEERWEYSSMKEYLKTSLTFLSVNIFVSLFFFFSGGTFIPRTIFFTSLPISFLFIIFLRVFYRGLNEVSNSSVNNIAIVCKEKNLQKIFDMLSYYNVSGIFLEDRVLKGRLFRGVPVYYDLSLLRRLPVTEVFVDKEVSYDFYLSVISNKPVGSVIKKIEISPFVFIESFRAEDVIRRERREFSLNIDPEKIYLVLGAGGSIGRYISKKLINLGAKNLKFLDYSEEGLHNLSLELLFAQNCKKEFILFDIKDDKLSEVIGDVDVVFHCAANKHVPIVENNKYTAFSTNVYGIFNVLENLKRNDREFVFISTDKAVNPTSFMGLTKRIGELFTLSFKDDFSKVIVVRFGNVFGTSGSLIPSIIKQITMYNKVFLTDENVKRYFMMPEEAAKLIIKSLEVENGKIAVLDMGEQLKIKDVVEKIIDILNVKVDIEIIGLRKGEKLEEELFYDFEKIIDKKDYIFVVEPNIYLSKDYVFSFISGFNEKLSSLSNTVELDKFVEDECLNFVNNLKIVKSF